MRHDEAKEPIKIYLDDQEEPFKVEQPPLRFNFSTIQLPDGPHTLRIEASNGLAPPTTKEIPFRVRNGVALSVSGLEEGQTIGGQVELIINAYAGNTEVDFEPQRAETPEPIPTWAWVLFLTIFAWTMFYILNPSQAYDALEADRRPEAEVGERLYVDTCARCHGESGDGRWIQTGPKEGEGYFRVPPLRDQPDYALADSPYPLLQKVVLGVKGEGIPMPQWGPLLTNEEIVAVVNHVRTTWRHDASTIDLKHRRPPAAIEQLEKELERSLLTKDADGLGRCCWPKGTRPPILFRTDETYAKGQKKVAAAWNQYFADLGQSGRVLQFKLTEKRYDYEEASVDQGGAIVIGMGRIFLQAAGEHGQEVTEKGRFIRVYQFTKSRTDPDDPGFWSLIFDFADIPMRVGCDIYCPPGQEPPGTTDPGGTTPVTPPPSGDGVGFAEVQSIFEELGKSAGDAPHEDFWVLPYEEFVTFEFEESWDDDSKEGNMIRLVEPGNVERSNLIRALEGKSWLIILKDGSEMERPVPAKLRMPKNGPFLNEEQMGKLRAWVAAGCPEVAGGPAHESAGGEAKDPDKDDAGGPDKDEPAAGDGAAGGVGFGDVIQAIKDLKKGAGDAPHEDFWSLPYEEFVKFRFDESWEDDSKEGNTIRLVVPGDPDRSNLVRAFEGKTWIVTLKDGSEIERQVPPKLRMPKNGPFMAAEGIALVRRWIADGCPETAGGAPHPDAIEPGGAVKEPEKEKTDGGQPPPEPPPAPPIASIGFKDVQQYLGDLGKTPSTVPHGAFWSELGYKDFVAFRFPRNYGDEEEYQLLIPYDAKNSNLVKVLVDGRGVVRANASGKRIVEDVVRMPKNAAPMPQDRIDKIIEWIDAGCPEFAGKPSEIVRGGGAAPAAPKPEDDDSPAPPPGGFPSPEGPAPESDK